MAHRALVTVALLLVAAGLWWLWPATLGGRTTYVVTQGVSMEPGFHSGDLALLRPASGYGVGDVVAYRGGSLGGVVVMHRIVAVEDGRFRLRGDNNSWLDPDRVPPSDVLGRLVGRIPRGGDLLLQLRQPSALAVGGALVALASALLRRRPAPGPRRMRHATRSRRRPSAPPRGPAYRHAAARSRAGTHLPPEAVTVTACVSAALLSVGVLAWVLPATQTRGLEVGYTQRSSLGYRASVSASPAYPAGRVVTGDPVYLALVPALDVAASYRVTTSARSSFRGTRSVDAVLATQDGWSRTVPLVASGPFRGAGFDVTAHLDLAAFERVIRDVEASTGVPIGAYTLTVRVDVQLSGTVAGRPVDRRSTPALAFTVDDHALRLDRQGPEEPAAGGTGRPQTSEEAASVRVPEQVPTAFALLGHEVPTSALRWWTPAAGCLLLLVLLGLRRPDRRRRQRAEADALGLDRYRPHLLQTASVAPVDGRTVIDLDSLDALARVAERYERFILRSDTGPQHDFVVDDGATVYRFRTPKDSGPVPLPFGIPRQRSAWETPDTDPAASRPDVGDQVAAFVERLRRNNPGARS